MPRHNGRGQSKKRSNEVKVWVPVNPNRTNETAEFNGGKRPITRKNSKNQRKVWRQKKRKENPQPTVTILPEQDSPPTTANIPPTETTDTTHKPTSRRFERFLYTDDINIKSNYFVDIKKDHTGAVSISIEIPQQTMSSMEDTSQLLYAQILTQLIHSKSDNEFAGIALVGSAEQLKQLLSILKLFNKNGTFGDDKIIRLTEIKDDGTLAPSKDTSFAEIKTSGSELYDPNSIAHDKLLKVKRFCETLQEKTNAIESHAQALRPEDKWFLSKDIKQYLTDSEDNNVNTDASTENTDINDTTGAETDADADAEVEVEVGTKKPDVHTDSNNNAGPNNITATAPKNTGAHTALNTHGGTSDNTTNTEVTNTNNTTGKKNNPTPTTAPTTKSKSARTNINQSSAPTTRKSILNTLTCGSFGLFSKSKNIKHFTEGYGDCFFHACFGKEPTSRWSWQPYKTDKANAMRKAWANFLGKYESLADPNMPEQLKNELVLIFSELLVNPAELKKVPGFAAKHKQYQENCARIGKRVNNLRENIIKDFTAKLSDKNTDKQIIADLEAKLEKLHNSIRDARRKHNAKCKDQKNKKPDFGDYKKLHGSKTIDKDYLKELINEDLQKCACLYDNSLTKDEFAKHYKSTSAGEAFYSRKDFYDAYKQCIQRQDYYVFLHEIRTIASIANVTVELFRDDNLNKPDKVLKPIREITRISPKNEKLWGKPRTVKIYHSGNHYSHVSSRSKAEAGAATDSNATSAQTTQTTRAVSI